MVGFRETVRKGLRVLFPGLGGTSLGTGVSALLTLPGSALPGSTKDYRTEAGSLWLNPAVSICLNRISTAMMESELRIEIRKAKGWEPAERPEALALLERPNPFYSQDVLLRATVLSLCVDGNAFWLKARAGSEVAELYWAAPWRFRPLYPADGSKFLTGWTYELNGQRSVLAPEDVVHFRWGLDPMDERLGLAPLAALIREVVSDNQATAYTAALLTNMGTPGVLLSPSHPDAKLSPADQERLRAQWMSRAGGDNRGKPIVMTGAMKAEMLAFSPEQLTLDRIRAVPEDRICAALQVPAMVAGLTTGAAHKTYANYGEAIKDFWLGGIIPLEGSIADTLTQQLLLELLAGGRYRFAWDYSQVHALAADQMELMTRATLGYEKGILKRAEARNLLGLQSDAADEVYYLTPGMGGVDANATSLAAV